MRIALSLTLIAVPLTANAQYVDTLETRRGWTLTRQYSVGRTGLCVITLGRGPGSVGVGKLIAILEPKKWDSNPWGVQVLYDTEKPEPVRPATPNELQMNRVLWQGAELSRLLQAKRVRVRIDRADGETEGHDIDLSGLREMHTGMVKRQDCATL